jgi:hypothetical protein
VHLKCAKSCGTCDINKKNAQSHAQPVVSSALSEDERKLVESTTDFGDLQVVSGAEAEKTLDVVRKTVDYMKNEARSLPDSTIDKCLNRNQLCSFWAAIGECDANQAFSKCFDSSVICSFGQLVLTVFSNQCLQTARHPASPVISLIWILAAPQSRMPFLL